MELSNADVVKRFEELFYNTNSCLAIFKDAVWGLIDTFEVDNLLEYIDNSSYPMVGVVRTTLPSGSKRLRVCMINNEFIDIYTQPLNGSDDSIVVVRGSPSATEIYLSFNYLSPIMLSGGLEYIEFMVSKVPTWVKSLTKGNKHDDH